MSQRLLLGGSFDPPHLGHVAMANEMAKRFAVPGITFVPNYVNPFKELSVSAQHRVAMLEICVPEGCDILTYEVEKESPSYTIETLRYLAGQSDDELRWLIGADCLENLHLWKDIEEIFELARLQLFTRPGASLMLPDTLSALMGEAGQKMLDEVIELQIPYSSSQIRDGLVGCGQVVGLDEKVLAYIRQHKLYESVGL